MIIVVPAKPLDRAKQRLAEALSADERARLCLAMLADVCGAATTAGAVIVVASDARTIEVARDAGARVVRDPTPNAGLNASLEAAIPKTNEGVLILASDLPAVSHPEIESMMQQQGVCLAVDTTGRGTNALWRNPSEAIPLAFGDDSARHHEELARERGIAVERIDSPGLRLDIDLPEHLAAGWEANLGDRTRAALRSFGFPQRLSSLVSLGHETRNG